MRYPFCKYAPLHFTQHMCSLLTYVVLYIAKKPKRVQEVSQRVCYYRHNFAELLVHVGTRNIICLTFSWYAAFWAMTFNLSLKQSRDLSFIFSYFRRHIAYLLLLVSYAFKILLFHNIRWVFYIYFSGITSPWNDAADRINFDSSKLTYLKGIHEFSFCVFNFGFM